MNRKWVYWVATSLVSLVCLASALMYLTNMATAQDMFVMFGYPGYLVPLLALVKIAAVAVILSRISVSLSDLAYAGMFFHLFLAAGAHIGVADYFGAVPAILALILLLVSFVTQNVVRRKASPCGSLSAIRGRVA
ncbi:DoxX family protein [Devosia sp. LjRoot3]|uniref:DoxX family protein n=1 Tax=Devosia sp. LjRoot3 TaxID=3342319 RepID=UPI003ECC99FB